MTTSSAGERRDAEHRDRGRHAHDLPGRQVGQRAPNPPG